jgi:hypothetical protein
MIIAPRHDACFVSSHHGVDHSTSTPLKHLPLKNHGYHFDHNYGHGEQHLSVVLATLMMLAFLVDQTQQLCCALFRAVWEKLGSKRLLWERMRALFFDYALESMRQLLEALFYGLKKSAPQLDVDSS